MRLAKNQFTNLQGAKVMSLRNLFVLVLAWAFVGAEPAMAQDPRVG
jgi:hypothetical protein